MKLALFTNQFPAKVSTFISRDIIALMRNGISIDIFPIYPVNDKNWQNVPVEWRKKIQNNVPIHYIFPSVVDNIPSIIKEDTSKILAQSCSFGYSQFLKSLFVIRQAINLQKKSNHKDYDSILSYWGNYSATYAYLYSKIVPNKIPFSFFLHAGTDLYRDRIYLKEKIFAAKNIYTVCEFNKIYLAQLFPQEFHDFEKKIIIHHLGLDIENFECKSENRREDLILCVGSMNKVKGFDYVIKALPRVLHNYSNITLCMIGDGPEMTKLKKLARKLGVINSVKFLGWQPFEIVKKFMGVATMLIHPSCDLGDAVPTVIKEALATGLPVIGSNIVGIPELLDNGRCGVLVPPKDVIALSEAISDLLTDEEKRVEYAKSGRLFAEQKFDMWQNGRKLAESFLNSTSEETYQ